MTTVQLKDTQQGDTIQFAGYEWIVLEPSQGYLWMNGELGTRVFDSHEDTYWLDPDRSTNIAYYLNRTWLPTLSSAAQDMIKVHSWQSANYSIDQRNPSPTGVRTASAKVGLIGAREWKKYSSYTQTSSACTSFYCYDSEAGFLSNPSQRMWTRDRHLNSGASNTSSVWYISGGPVMSGDADKDLYYVRPAIYLDTEVEIVDGEVYVPPEHPTITNFEVDDVGIDYLLIKWEADEKAETYTVKRDGVVIYQGTGTSLNDSGLESNREYTYTVIATNEKGDSEEVSITVSTLPKVYVLDEGKRIISNLDGGGVVKGNPVTVPLYVKNNTDETLRNVYVSLGEVNIPPLNTVEYSFEEDFRKRGRYLKVKRLQPREERPFYVKLKSLGGRTGEGKFNIDVHEDT